MFWLIAMPRKPGRAAELRALIASRGHARIGETEFRELREALAPLSDDALRRLLRACGLPLAPLVEGVRLSSFEDLERTLLAILVEYETALQAGDAGRARQCRKSVVAAKDRARLAARSARDPRRRADKLEMAEWLLLWLETPGLFPSWAGLRKRAKAGA